MSIHFHHAGDETNLLYLLTKAAEGAVSVTAAFAWASERGLRLLLDSSEFRELLQRSSVCLLIGTDSVTDTKALQAAKALAAEHSNLDIRLFVHDKKWIFHPKATFFEYEDGRGVVVVGSGNLTDWGLRSNWEISLRAELNPYDFAMLMADYNAWWVANSTYIYPLDAPAVAQSAMLNSGTERSIRHSPPPAKPMEEPLADASWLVAELNKSRKNSIGQSMFSQASFDRATIEEFFGYVEGGTEISLISVESNGATGSLETRRARYKPASVNYYFGIRQAAGMP